MINELAKQVYENAKAKGFWDEDRNVGEMLALIHSEVSEALEAHRKGIHADIKGHEAYKELFAEDYEARRKHNFEAHIKDSFSDELADVVIRVMDLAAAKGIDLEFHIQEKMWFNSTRERKHGKNY